MPGLVDTPSPLLFWLLPLLISVPCAVWKDTLGGLLPAAAVAAAIATLLYVGFLIAEVGYSPTGTSIAAAFTLIPYALLCTLIAWLVSSLLNRLKRKS